MAGNSPRLQIPIYVFLLDAYFSMCYHISIKGRVAERLASKNRLSCPVTILRSETGQLFYFTKYLKSYLSCFCIKAITATISTHKSNIQLNASKVTILRSSRCNGNLPADKEVKVGTAVCIFSPARSAADSAVNGTVQRSGTPTANTERPSGNAIISTTAIRPAPLRTLPMQRFRQPSSGRQTSCSPQRTRSSRTAIP